MTRPTNRTAPATAMALGLVALLATASPAHAAPQTASVPSRGAAAAPAIGQSSTAPATATLTVRFEGFEVPTGQIMMSLFDNEAAHDGGGEPLRGAAIRIDANAAVATFPGLQPGRYAIKAFHDVDGDGRMKANPFGSPLEPFAFSNNAPAAGGPAPWKASSFDVPAGTSETRILIK